MFLGLRSFLTRAQPHRAQRGLWGGKQIQYGNQISFSNKKYAALSLPQIRCLAPQGREATCQLCTALLSCIYPAESVRHALPMLPFQSWISMRSRARMPVSHTVRGAGHTSDTTVRAPILILRHRRVWKPNVQTKTYYRCVYARMWRARTLQTCSCLAAVAYLDAQVTVWAVGSFVLLCRSLNICGCGGVLDSP